MMKGEHSMSFSGQSCKVFKINKIAKGSAMLMNLQTCKNIEKSAVNLLELL